MNLTIISGLSGSGKTVALHTLEDEDYYCVDNMPLGLLPEFVKRVIDRTIEHHDNIAVGIDARSASHDLKRFSEIIRPLRELDINIEVIYLQAEQATLIKRYSDTRRRHPLTRKGLPLADAIEAERSLLSDITAGSDLFIDTTFTNIHQLRELVKERIVRREKKNSLSVLFQSFGFKHGTPTDSDFIFDVRCLPNPHWEHHLRPLNGLDAEVMDFLKKSVEVEQMLDDIRDFLETWVPKFEQQNRYYLTISIGCTGGQHRSVYISQQLSEYFRDRLDTVSVRHRELV
jgi:RNase adapter protein RapZ